MKDLFLPYEPRAVYPFFAGMENRLNYVLRATYVPSPKAALRHVVGRILSRGHAANPRFLTRVVTDSLRGIRVRFRGAFLDRDGHLVAEIPPFAEVRYLQGFDISIDQLLQHQAVPRQDGQFLLIADRGIKLDGGYSIGTIGAVFRSPTAFACYRNGAFARPVNEFSHHRPRGFRSIAPHMICNETSEASAYFFNFSSDPHFDRTAAPRVRLYRSRDEWLEGTFGEIPPWGARERTLTEMFGAGVRDFLGPVDGMGTVIAVEDGLTLGSLHLIRNRVTGAMAIEHTRPVRLYVS